MSSTSLQHKTVRPGSLVGFSYYHSSRQVPTVARTAPQSFRPSIDRRLLRWAVIAVLIVGVLFIAPLLRGGSTPSASTPAIAPAQTTANHCAVNKTGQLILVSISQRRLWACQGTKTAYNSAVITGMEAHASTLTPPGTYHIYSKQTNITLTGSDETGSWNDPVQYWMPFLNNGYGTYGFHDATWRAASAFGKISPASADASHGCVELPIGTSQWLYNWARVGTTVTIES